jgi:hypothetical protein
MQKYILRRLVLIESHWEPSPTGEVVLPHRGGIDKSKRLCYTYTY